MHRELPPDELGTEPTGAEPAPPTMPARRVITIVLAALTLGALFNAEYLLETAERQPFGATRSIAVAFAEPLASVSNALKLTAPRSAVEDLLRGDPALVLAEGDVVAHRVRPRTESGGRFDAYFVHGYAAPVGEDCVAAASHGRAFAAVVSRGRVHGAQFHPERSAATGARILANFLALEDAA